MSRLRGVLAAAGCPGAASPGRPPRAGKLDNPPRPHSAAPARTEKTPTPCTANQAPQGPRSGTGTGHSRSCASSFPNSQPET